MNSKCVRRAGSLVALSLAASALFLLSQGCAKKSESFGKDVLAMADGRPVTVQEFKLYTEEQGMASPEEKVEALNEIIRNRLVALDAQAKGLLGDPKVMSRLEQFYVDTLPAKLRKKVASETTVTDEELPGYNERASLKPKLTAEIIVAGSLEKAEAAKAEIDKGNAFEKVEKDFSSMAPGPKVIDLSDDLIPQGVKAVLNRTKIGSVTPPMKMELGYVVCKVLSRKEPEDVWKDKAAALRSEAKKRKADARIEAMIDSWKKTADIKFKSTKFPDGEVRETSVVVNGMEILPDPTLQGASSDPHSPHRNMNPQSMRAALDKVVDNYILSQEARRLGLQNDPDFKLLYNLKVEEVLTDEYMNTVKGTYAVTQQDIADYYAKNKDKFVMKPTVRVSRILAGDEKAAEKALARVKSGEDFGRVANALSTDRKSAERGGDAGWVLPENTKEPMKSALAKMQPGSVGGVFKTDYGYEVVKVTEKRPGGQADISQVSDRISKRVVLIKRSARLEDYLSSVNKKANISINKELLAALTR